MLILPRISPPAMSLERQAVPHGSTTTQSNSTGTSARSGDSDRYDALPLRTIDEEHSETETTALSSRYIDESENETDSLPLRRNLEALSPQRSRHQVLPFAASNEPLVGHVDRSPVLMQSTSTAPNVRRSQYVTLSMVDAGDDSNTPSGPTTAFAAPSPKGLKEPSWRPFALRRPALLATLLISLILGFVVIVLLAYSTVQKGLGTDGGSSAVLFGWRFSPTLVAVLYALLPTMIFDDALITEPFAQMSHPSGAPSATSILKRPRQWWNVLVDSFKRRQNHGRVNYFLLSTVLVNMISSLLISPLSSALLQSQSVQLVSQVPISQFTMSEGEPVLMAANDLVYFRTIGNVLQNLDTTAWLTDQYLVIPWWPSSSESNLGTTLMDTTQQWNASAQVLSVELECEPMNIHKASWTKNFTDPDTGEDRPTNFRSLLLTDSKGCKAGINGYNQRFTAGGGSWFAPPNLVLPVWDDSDDENEWDHYHNSTSQCVGRQIILATSGNWQGTTGLFNPDLKAGAWSCQSMFYAANMSVNASTTTTGTTVLVDDATFKARRQPVPNIVIDQERFETAFLHKNWTSMIYTADVNGQDSYGGPSALLAALHNFDSASLIDSGAVVKSAQKVRQRFLGEMVMATIAENAVESSQTGQITDTQRRVIVNVPVAIALAVLFIVTSALIAAVLFLSSRRNLNLHHNPGSVAAVVKLIEGNTVIRDYFHAQNQRKAPGLDDSLVNSTPFLNDGSIASVKGITDTTGIHDSDLAMFYFELTNYCRSSITTSPRSRELETIHGGTIGRTPVAVAFFADFRRHPCSLHPLTHNRPLPICLHLPDRVSVLRASHLCPLFDHSYSGGGSGSLMVGEYRWYISKVAALCHHGATGGSNLTGDWTDLSVHAVHRLDGESIGQ